MNKEQDTKIALITQKHGEVTAYNAAGEVLGLLQKDTLVHSYSSNFVVLANLNQSAAKKLFELRNKSLDFIKYIDESEILRYLNEDIVHFPLFLHLDSATELEKLKDRNCSDNEQYQNLIHASHSFDRFILKIAKRECISYVNFRFEVNNDPKSLLNKIHAEVKRFLEKNVNFEVDLLQKKAEELIEVELIGLKNN